MEDCFFVFCCSDQQFRSSALTQQFNSLTRLFFLRILPHHFQRTNKLFHFNFLFLLFRIVIVFSLQSGLFGSQHEFLISIATSCDGTFVSLNTSDTCVGLCHDKNQNHGSAHIDFVSFCLKNRRGYPTYTDGLSKGFCLLKKCGAKKRHGLSEKTGYPTHGLSTQLLYLHINMLHQLELVS